MWFRRYAQSHEALSGLPIQDGPEHLARPPPRHVCCMSCSALGKNTFGVRKGLVSDNVISYIEMCRRERTSLQQYMNFGLGGNHSVILMSVLANAPYRDRLEDSGTTLLYEGHDMPKGASFPNPKCKFKLIAVEGEADFEQPVHLNAERRRLIPTHVKLEVWKRDAGMCSMCGAVDELHFDHILPFAKGGTSMTAVNVQLLCARHNLAKSDHIE